MVSAACCSLMSAARTPRCLSSAASASRSVRAVAWAWSRSSASAGSVSAAASARAMIGAVRAISAALSAAKRAKTCSVGRSDDRAPGGALGERGGRLVAADGDLDDAAQQRGLGGVGEVHGLLGHAGLRGDRLHARARVAVAQEQGLGGVADPAAGLQRGGRALGRPVRPPRTRRRRVDRRVFHCLQWHCSDHRNQRLRGPLPRTDAEGSRAGRQCHDRPGLRRPSTPRFRR